MSQDGGHNRPRTHQGLFSEHSVCLHAGAKALTTPDAMSLFTDVTVSWGRRHQACVPINIRHTDGEGDGGRWEEAETGTSGHLSHSSKALSYKYLPSGA